MHNNNNLPRMLTNIWHEPYKKEILQRTEEKHVNNTSK